MQSGTQPHSFPTEEGLGDGEVSLHVLVEALLFFLEEKRFFLTEIFSFKAVAFL